MGKKIHLIEKFILLNPDLGPTALHKFKVSVQIQAVELWQQKTGWHKRCNDIEQLEQQLQDTSAVISSLQPFHISLT